MTIRFFISIDSFKLIPFQFFCNTDFLIHLIKLHIPMFYPKRLLHWKLDLIVIQHGGTKEAQHQWPKTQVEACHFDLYSYDLDYDTETMCSWKLDNTALKSSKFSASSCYDFTVWKQRSHCEHRPLIAEKTHGRIISWLGSTHVAWLGAEKGQRVRGKNKAKKQNERSPMSVACLEDIVTLMYHIFSQEESVIAFCLTSNDSNNTQGN